MKINISPTKANLIKAKASLELSQKGFSLLDKKRTVLIKEVMSLMERASELQARVDDKFKEAYRNLQIVNMTIGIHTVEEVALSISKDEYYEILYRSVMGLEIPRVKYYPKSSSPNYSFFRTNPALDKAVKSFQEAKYLVYELAEVENSVYKLSMEIKKTQKRANALDKIQIPNYQDTVKYIQDVLEEKEREDFFRLKKVKSRG